MNNKFFKILNILLVIVYLAMIIFNLGDLKTVIILFLILTAPIIFKFIIKNLPDYYVSMYYIMVLISYVGGEVYRYYYLYWWYDLAVHFTSGVFDSFLALSLLKTIKINNWFTYVFPIIFTSFISVLWEILEYVDDLMFHRDPQWVQSTGVSDTMQDMIVALIASTIFVIIKLIHDRYFKNAND